MIKLYYANITLVQEPDIFEKYLKKLNLDRREKVLRYKQMADKERSLLAGILLRYAMEQEGLHYESLSFSCNKYGKPYLEGIENLFFSLSHANEYVICGIADSPIGVDIETCNRAVLQKKKDIMERMARKSFTPEEFLYFKDSEKKKEVFLRLWTRKESYTKAIGRGLGMDVSRISVLEDTENGKFWSDWFLGEYYVSVYLDKKSKEQPMLIEWSPQMDSFRKE